jgi:hypothetical protein
MFSLTNFSKGGLEKMAADNYEKYLIRKPLYQEIDGAGLEAKTYRSPALIYLSDAQVPGVKYHVELRWIDGMPKSNRHLHDMAHNYDEIILHWGLDSATPQDLGSEIELYIAGQPITFNTTTAVFVPREVPHGPLTWRKFNHPHIQMSVVFGTGNTREIWGNSGVKEAKKEWPQKTAHFDYEQYVVRNPVREMLGGAKITNRQIPTMTYMSKHQVIGANYYLEFGWVYGIPQPNPHIPEHMHSFDEILLHISGDPQNPENLGGEIEYYIGGQPLTFDTSSVLFLPKGLKHSPIIWKKFQKPHIEMAIMIGVGSLKDAGREMEQSKK